MGFRASPEMRASVVRWAEAEPDKPSLSEAIRRLVEWGLTVKTTASTTDRSGQRRRAQELAENAIGEIGDSSAHPDERAHRRRRLTKGPEEFRDVRIDRSKAKPKG
jgi:hypothetical protein